MHHIHFVYFGDSITECTNIEEFQSWPFLCASELKEKFNGQATFENEVFAVCGENTRQALERMQPKVQSREADIMTILFGTNDSDYWLSNRGVPVVSKSAFHANLVEMVDRARTFGVKKVVLITVHAFATTRVEINQKTHNENILAYNGIIRNVALEKECKLVDIHKVLSSYSPKKYTLPLPDGVHLSVEGCRMYAEAILPILEKCVQEVIKESQICN